MSSLEKRVTKLEEERLPNSETIRREQEMMAAIEAGRKRVKAANPDFEFNDEPLEPAPLLPNGKFDLVAALEQGRRRAMERRKP